VNDYANALALGEPADHYSALIQIIDSGQGMDMHTLESAFDRTFSTKHSAGIHGLGLQSVKALIDQNLAFVRVESELGKGSCFSLYMKSPDLIPRDVETSPPVLATHSSGHIFIIDDDPYVGDMLQATLTNLGYDALWYEFPLRALKDLHETPPALIITDFNMPDMSGKEFATQAREILPTVPIVVYSGQAASITPSLLYSAILKKPVKADALDKVIKSLIKS